MPQQRWGFLYGRVSTRDWNRRIVSVRERAGSWSEDARWSLLRARRNGKGEARYSGRARQTDAKS